MRKALLLLVVLMIAYPLHIPARALTRDQIYSRSAVLIDAQSGQVLFDKGMHERAYPASTTKIMTGLLAVELCSPDEVITVSPSAVAIDEWNSTNIALIPGERLTVDDALYALMLYSANDAANVLAEHIAGSQQQFVILMNERAAQMGLENTHFSNAHGLHAPDHYTTSYDMALITLYAAQNPDFMRYFGEETHTMAPTNLQPLQRPFVNHQSMLVRNGGYYYPGVSGGKVGYTTEAQHTMSTIATQNGRTLICTVMYSGERSLKFADTKHLLDYGFEEFHQISLPAGIFETESIPTEDGSAYFYSGQDFTALLRNDLNKSAIEVRLDLPEHISAEDPQLTYASITIDTADETLPSLLGNHPLVAEITVDPVYMPVMRTPALPPLLWGKSDEPFAFTPLFLAVLVLSGVLLILVSLLLSRYHTLKKRRQSRGTQIHRRSQRYTMKKSA